MPTKKSVTIRGIEYASVSDAALALGVTKATVSLAIKHNRLDSVGKGLGHGNANRSKPVKVRGIVYRSINDAAQKLGVTKAVVQQAVRRGTEDNIGVGRREYGNAAMPIRIRGVEYPSQTIAAQVLGVTTTAISMAIKRGSLDTVGLGPKRNI